MNRKITAKSSAGWLLSKVDTESLDIYKYRFAYGGKPSIDIPSHFSGNQI